MGWVPAPSGSGSDTDWTEDVNSVYNSTKNIGIGTSSPSVRLHLLDNDTAQTTPSMTIENSVDYKNAEPTIHFKNNYSLNPSNFTLGGNSITVDADGQFIFKSQIQKACQQPIHLYI